MPNHLHLLVKPLGGNQMPPILHSWKSFTANEINKALGTHGQVWQKESYDHIVRNQESLQAFRKYIRDNPKGNESSDNSKVQNRDGFQPLKTSGKNISSWQRKQHKTVNV
jgi:hypothetical protein